MVSLLFFFAPFQSICNLLQFQAEESCGYVIFFRFWPVVIFFFFGRSKAKVDLADGGNLFVAKRRGLFGEEAHFPWTNVTTMYLILPRGLS